MQCNCSIVLACVSKTGVNALNSICIWNSVSYLFWELTQGPFIVVMLNVMGDHFLKIYMTEAKQQYNQQLTNIIISVWCA